MMYHYVHVCENSCANLRGNLGQSSGRKRRDAKFRRSIYQCFQQQTFLIHDSWKYLQKKAFLAIPWPPNRGIMWNFSRSSPTSTAPPPRNQKGKSWTSAAAFERDWPSFLFNPLFSHTHGEGANQDKVGGQNRTNLEKLKMYLGWEKMVPLLLHNNNFTSLSSETQKRQIMTTCVHECQISVHSKPTSKYKWW